MIFEALQNQALQNPKKKAGSTKSIDLFCYVMLTYVSSVVYYNIANYIYTTPFI